MRYVLLLSVMIIAGIAVAEPVESISLDPAVYLPDGSEFKTWRCVTEFTRTYWVDRHHPEASDDNPGTPDKPLLTINRGAQLVEPGQRVVIKSGVYREHITPRLGGEGPDKMISYEAAPGARVVITGSQVVPSDWKPSRNPGQFSEKLWMTRLPESLFERENPFALENASAEDIAIMPWATEWSGRVPYTLKRGLIFQDGRRLAQLAAYEDLVRLPGSYWVGPDGLTLHIHPFDEVNPNDCLMEVTVQQHLFKPDVTDLGYIRIKGLTFMHAGNGYPRTGVGAIFAMGGHHWLIEDNTVSQVSSVGIEIGTRSLESADRAASRADSERARLSPGFVIVRNNHLSECGTGGIQGLAVRKALVEGNHIFHCGWQDVERYYETAGIKLLINEDTLVRRNVVAHFTAGPAIWLDWDNKNSRVTQNLAYDILMCCNGAMFVEASQVPNMVDNNILWDIRGTGIYTGDTDNLIIAHNLIGPCTGPGVHTRVATDRSVGGRRVTSKNNKVFNNIFYTSNMILFQDKENASEGNVFADPEGSFDLAKWRDGGYDQGSVSIDMQLEFDPEGFELHWSTAKLLPRFKPVRQINFDYHNTPRAGEMATPGPFHDCYAGPIVLNVHPLGSEQ